MLQEEGPGAGNRGIITVIGIDRVGIIAAVTDTLARHEVNILDISMTTLQEMFTMIMIVDLAKMTVDFTTLLEHLQDRGREVGVKVTMQREEVFKAMHRI